MVKLETEEAKKQAETLQKMKDEAKDERAENRKKENAKKKRIKEQQDRIAMSEDSAVWISITKIKEDLEKKLKSNKLTSGYNIRNIVNLPNYFQYQHPTSKKKKSNNKNDKWVADFLKGGGTEKQLMEQAETTRTAIWRRTTWKRPKKESDNTTAPIKPKVSGGVG